MKQRTNKQINSDIKFDKEVEKLVTKECRRVLVISLRDDVGVMSGEKSCIDLVNSREDLTIKDLVNHMKGLGESTAKADFVYESTAAAIHFPPLERKFDGPTWDFQFAKNTVTQWFTILGYGRYGSKKYKKEQDEPPFWPDSESWTTFEHPSYSNLETINKILRSMMEFYGLNPETHHTEVINPDEPIRKKQKRRNKKTLKAQKKSQSFVEEDSDSEVVLSDMELNDQNEDPTTTTEASTTTTPSGPASTSTPTSTTTSKKAKKIMKTNLKPSKFLGDDSDDCETSSMDGLSESELLNRFGSDIDEDQDKTDSTGTREDSSRLHL